MIDEVRRVGHYKCREDRYHHFGVAKVLTYSCWLIRVTISSCLDFLAIGADFAEDANITEQYNNDWDDETAQHQEGIIARVVGYYITRELVWIVTNLAPYSANRWYQNQYWY